VVGVEGATVLGDIVIVIVVVVVVGDGVVKDIVIGGGVEGANAF
jgi:hypothetical protein